MNLRDIPNFELDDLEVAQLRVPPHSTEAESSVLGGLLLDNAAWDRVGDLLAEGDFYRHENRLIFAAIGQLMNASREADVMTVYDRLQGLGKADEVGGLAYINSLAQYVPNAGNIRRYAEIVRERSVLRKLISASDEIATTAFSTQGRPVAEIVDQAEQKIFKISESNGRSIDDWQSVDEGGVTLMDKLQDDADGKTVADFVSTGLTDLDARLDGGMRPGELIVIGARPSMGKSALALSIGIHVALNEKKPVGMLSMEMPTKQVVSRAASLLSRVHLSSIKRGERLRDGDWSRLVEGVEKMRDLPLYISDQSGLNINQVRSKARAIKRKKGLRVLIVDYLGLMSGFDPKQLRVYQLEDITKGLKSLAKEMGITVLLLAQLNRKVEERIDQMPMLSDLRDSGSIEQDADVVLFVHRPHKAKPELGDEWKYYAKALVAKVRDGEPGNFDLMYIGENTRFCDWPVGMERPRTQALTKSRGL